MLDAMRRVERAGDAVADLGVEDAQAGRGEIVDQVYLGQRVLAEADPERRISNLVYMGMGEPLHNYDNLKKALATLLSPDGPNFSHRHITVSTSGLVPAIEKVGRELEIKLGELEQQWHWDSLERIFIPNRKNPVNLLPHQPAYKLLTHVRDEAHRFAVSYHRLLRSKRSLAAKGQDSD